VRTAIAEMPEDSDFTSIPRGCPFTSPITWTWSTGPDGRCAKKNGAIAEDLPPILKRIGITRAAWLELAKDFETTFCSWIGQAEHVERVCARGGQRWACGIRACRRLFPS